nr:diguanylate cyclase [Kineosporia rhizophila]
MLCLMTTAFVWRRRRQARAATVLAGTMSATAVWCLADAAVAYWTWLPPTAFFLVLIASVHAVSAGTLCFNYMVTDPQWRLRRRWGCLLLVAPVLACAAVATNGQHGLFFQASTDQPDAAVVLDFGPFFWAHTAYCYALAGWALSRLVRAWWRAPSVFRRQYLTMIIADLAPSAALVAGGLGGHASSGMDLTPFGFALTGVLITYALLAQGMLRLVPVTRARIVDSLPDGVFVVDPAGTLIDVNTAGRALLATARPDLPTEVVGWPARDLLISADLIAALDSRAETGSDGMVKEVRPGLHLAFQFSNHHDERGRMLARVVTARDISAVVAAERALHEHVRTIEALRANLQEEAVRDALTGLHNRRHANVVLEEAVAARSAFAALLLDVDHFKAVNDTFGHHGGDQVLRAVARALNGCVRTSDLVARWGGEEFLIVLPGMDLEAGAARAERVRLACSRIGQGTSRPGAPPQPTVTVSVGVAAYPLCGQSGEEVLAAADAALYEAKGSGRNRVCVASGGVSHSFAPFLPA